MATAKLPVKPVIEEPEKPDHTMPYPEAPEVEHGNVNQEHYRGARDPELAKPAIPPFRK